MAVGADGRLLQRANDTETFEQALERRVIKGYAVIWNKPNQHREIFLPGAFDVSIRENGPNSSATYKIKFMYKHREELVLFARLYGDEIGLYFETNPLDKDPESDKVLMRVRNGSLNNFSVGFDFLWDVENSVEWSSEMDAIIVRQAKLFEISAVPIPSALDTFVTRSKEDVEEEILQLDKDIAEMIDTLPKNRRLEVREMFARQKSHYNVPQKEQTQAQEVEPKNVTGGINYDYLLKNL